MKEVKAQEDLLLKVKAIRGDVMSLHADIKGLLQTIIDAGGRYSKGVKYKRRKHLMDYGNQYNYIRVIQCDVLTGNYGPYIRFVVQPLKNNGTEDRRFNPVFFEHSVVENLWEIF